MKPTSEELAKDVFNKKKVQDWYTFWYFFVSFWEKLKASVESLTQSSLCAKHPVKVSWDMKHLKKASWEKILTLSSVSS